MRLSSLKFGILKFLPSMDKCLNANKLIIPFGKKPDLHDVRFILEL